MSWKVGLYLSESFAELSARHREDGPIISKFWYLRAKGLLDGLNEFFEQNKIGDGSVLRVSTFWPEMVVQKNLGNPPMLLVSSGFEDWLQLRQPKKSVPPAIPPERHRSFFSSDYIFGISERTDAEGKIHKKPLEEELEFLHQKFMLNDSKNLAIGFLHSRKNPENEKKVAEYFRNKGYRVWASHEYGGGSNEVSRWWRSGLEAYSSNTLDEMNEPLIQFCKQRGAKIEIADINNLGSSFEVFNRIGHLYKNNGYDDLLWADLRAFTLINLKCEQKFTETLWGPIAAQTPRMKQLRIKPTSLIEIEGLRGMRRDFFDIGFDPGPMSFGRGVKPCLFDLLYALDFLDAAEVSAYINQSSKDKIRQSLAITMRVLLKNEPNWQDFLSGWMRTQLVTEIIEFVDHKKILVVGPLANSIAKLLKKNPLEMKIEPDSNYCGSHATLNL